jgi:hypothetical protein
LVVVVVSQLTAYGAAVTRLPGAFPSRKNWTDATAQVSEAFAATGAVPDTVSLAVGFVMLTVGAVVSFPPVHRLLAVMVTVIAAAVDTSPPESVACALRVWVPGEVLPTFQLYV